MKVTEEDIYVLYNSNKRQKNCFEVMQEYKWWATVTSVITNYKIWRN